MTVTATAKRRRREARQDKRFKPHVREKVHWDEEHVSWQQIEEKVTRARLR
jgi:hypothetical protein